MVFLQGLRAKLNKNPASHQELASSSMSATITKLEPLLKKVPRSAIAATIKTGLNSPDPAVRAFCFVIASLADATHC